ncbi:hypothetical protein N4R57_10415 [Rhodobacteraceae bacterium D3-12]|nr:hypothetical protein N4R57_10415 [Rhodobacteraceae bacterium D3-12]
METIKTLFSIKDGTVGGGLILLLIGGLLAGLGRMLLWANQDRRERRKRLELEQHEQARAAREREQHLREVIVDVILHAEFDRESVARITNATSIAAMKEVIAATEKYRPFVAYEERDLTFDDYRGIRRQLDTPLMVACDRFFDLSQLFQAYYKKLASDDFVALSIPRKHSALDTLVDIGARVERAYETVSQKMQTSPISAEIYGEVTAILPDPKGIPKNNKTAQISPDGASNSQ